MIGGSSSTSNPYFLLTTFLSKEHGTREDCGFSMTCSDSIEHVLDPECQKGQSGRKTKLAPPAEVGA